MDDEKIYFLAENFRKLIERAKNKNYFLNTKFEKIPIQCCGDASILLAEFLRTKGIKTIWISNENFDTYETHAWLVVKDDRIKVSEDCFDDIPNSVLDIVNLYGGNNRKKIREQNYYDKNGVENGLIVDITGDQFGEHPVYVGYMDRFHEQFDFVMAEEYEGLYDEEDIKLYEIIMNQ